MSNNIILPPDADRVIESLRDTGYTLDSAIADLVDNSIAADATRIDIFLNTAFNGAVTIFIVDNGTGMTESELVDAMRYGSKKKPDPRRLGKFGLGLKTASTAFCRQLEVTSRSTDGYLGCACWDLDTIAKTNAWSLELKEPPKDALKHLETISPGKSGTVVAWRKIDRLFSTKYKDPTGKHATNALDKTIAGLRFHLGLTFQRFLDGTTAKGSPALKMNVNNEPVIAWNPFLPQEEGRDFTETTIPIILERPDKTEEHFSFTLGVCILPSQADFSTREAYTAAHISLKNQGIYVYRHDRLLSYGTWLGTLTPHNSLNLLRVSFDFDHRLDDVFSVPVNKATISIDEGIQERLEKDLIPFGKAAEQRRKQGQTKKKLGGGDNMHGGSNTIIDGLAGDIPQATSRIVDAKTGQVDITNPSGTVRIKLNIEQDPSLEKVFIQEVDNINNGLLFEPSLINGKIGVSLNTSHPYFSRVYVPNQNRGVTIQGLDSLLWALCTAEMNNMTTKVKDVFEDIRFEVSRTLRKLVEELPNPQDDDE